MLSNAQLCKSCAAPVQSHELDVGYQLDMTLVLHELAAQGVRLCQNHKLSCLGASQVICAAGRTSAAAHIGVPAAHGSSGRATEKHSAGRSPEMEAALSSSGGAVSGKQGEE